MVPSEPDPKSKTIVICDDENDILRSCSLILRGRYRVLTAGSGKECISLCREQEKSGSTIDLILLDYRLGDMSAEEVVTKIKGAHLRVKVILTTALDLDEATSPILARENLIDSQLRKPFSAAELVSKVEQYL